MLRLLRAVVRVPKVFFLGDPVAEVVAEAEVPGLWGLGGAELEGESRGPPLLVLWGLVVVEDVLGFVEKGSVSWVEVTGFEAAVEAEVVLPFGLD